LYPVGVRENDALRTSARSVEPDVASASSARKRSTSSGLYPVGLSENEAVRMLAGSIM
jgi:hypothetical protein